MKEELLKLKKDLQNLRNYKEDKVELKRIKDTFRYVSGCFIPRRKRRMAQKSF